MKIEEVTPDEYRRILAGTRRTRTKRGPGPEQAIQNAILDYLWMRGHAAWRINSGAIKTERGSLVRLAPPGTSDIIGCVVPTGRMFVIEVKQPGKDATPLQQAFLDRMAEAGALAFVARSIEDVQEQGL